ncbi:sodium-independent sulfate anion transporter-like isoform X2 [Rhynchophorus ferrugineus]|uniref:sodium-independent sulfate anion transporter-like isoform X2 n=1 Tax=Rhynchophorus ferrugineus TaxID=354439 RepID=UPI003FCEE49A
MGKMVDESNEISMAQRVKKTLFKRIHILQWLPKYTSGDIVADFVAGLTVGLTMIPQSVAYAGLAGLTPQYGLYTAFIGSFTYIFFGTVKEVSIGPTSLMALLTFSYVVGKPVEFVILLTFIAGCVELAMGLFNLGFLVDFISPCVTNGFTSATSIIIISSQLKSFLGVSIKSHDTFGTWKELFGKVTEIKFADTLLGTLCVMSLLGFKQLNQVQAKTKTSKKTLWLLSISKNAIVVLLCSVISYIWYSIAGGTPFKLTGVVPSGLPSISFPPLYATVNNQTVNVLEMVKDLGSGMILIPVVAVLANVAIAKAYSSDTVVDASQEMISLGMANICGSFVKAMPSCGAFTRSSVASSSGVVTPLQGFYSGSVIILALSFLAPYFFYIPKATLAAVLIVAASSLIDYNILKILWRCNKIDFFITFLTFLVGVLIGVEMSIVVGAIFNALVLLKRWSRPEILVETRSTNQKWNYIYIRPELGLFYPAADYVTETVKKAHNRNPEAAIVLDCSQILQIDYSTAKSIEMLAKTYKEKKIDFALLNLNAKALKRLNSVMDTKNLALCDNIDNIYNTILNIQITNSPDEIPLLRIEADSSSDKKTVI